MRSRFQAPVIVAVVVLLFASLLSGSAVASHVAGPPSCPDPVPEDEIERGMTGTGYTVAEEDHLESFEAEVLGVLENGIGIGRDLIIVETSGDVIEDNGGIWYGISGSPIFVGNELLGAVAFGLAYGPATVAGVTPGTEMHEVLDYPDEDEEEGSAPSSRTLRRIRFSDSMRLRIAEATGSEMEQVAGSFTQLKVPLSVSGAPPRVMDRITEIMKAENAPLVPYAGSAASSAAAEGETDLRPGDNIAAALSYGDISFAAVGTTTFVCDGRVMAFGHPFLWEGATTIGANASETITVVQDPFFSYELATVEEGIGMINQDRYAGIAGTLGGVPPSIPVTADVNALNTDRTLAGRSDAVISEVVPFLAWIEVYGSILFAMDQYTEGSSEVTWTITGTTSSGETWTSSRSNMYSSEYGISDYSAYELESILYRMYYNEFEDIEFTGVHADATADDEIKQYTITDTLVLKDGEYREVRRIRARPGQVIDVRVTLEPYEAPEDGSQNRVVDLQVQVPLDLNKDAQLRIHGGAFTDDDVCFYRPQACERRTGRKIESFNDLLDFFASRPMNNELLASLRAGRRNRVKAEDRELLDQMIVGESTIQVRMGGGSRSKPVVEDGHGGGQRY